MVMTNMIAIMIAGTTATITSMATAMDTITVTVTTGTWNTIARSAAGIVRITNICRLDWPSATVCLPRLSDS
jgi:hypothetical protein